MEEAAAAAVVVVGEEEEALAVEVAWNRSHSLAVVAGSIAVVVVVQTHLMDRRVSSEGSRIAEMDVGERVHRRSSRLDYRCSRS